MARDVMAIAQSEVGSDTGGPSIEALRDWADQICDGRAHAVKLFDFEDEAQVDTIAETLVETCPSLVVIWAATHASVGCY